MAFALPISPRLVKGGIVTIDPDTSVVTSVIALQYNPDSLSRSLQIQAVPGGAGRCARRCAAAARSGDRDHQAGSRTGRDRPAGVPHAVSDDCAVRAASAARAVGDAGQPDGRDAACRTMRMANAGTLEIIPLEQPLTLFVWSTQPGRAGAAHRVLASPRRRLIRTSIRSAPRSVLGMRVLNVDDLGLRASGRADVHGLSDATRNRLADAGSPAALTTSWDWEGCHELSTSGDDEAGRGARR